MVNPARSSESICADRVRESCPATAFYHFLGRRKKGRKCGNCSRFRICARGVPDHFRHFLRGARHLVPAAPRIHRWTKETRDHHLYRPPASVFAWRYRSRLRTFRCLTRLRIIIESEQGLHTIIPAACSPYFKMSATKATEHVAGAPHGQRTMMME